MDLRASLTVSRDRDDGWFIAEFDNEVTAEQVNRAPDFNPGGIWTGVLVSESGPNAIIDLMPRA